jgi:repressor LexA
MDLTKRQQEIFDFIKRYSGQYGYPPTVRDIGKAVGLASSSTVHAHLANLEKLGPAAARPDQAARHRAARPGHRRRWWRTCAPRGRPGPAVVGAVAAGQPILAEENIEEYVQVPQARAARTASSSCACAASR